MRSLWVPPYWLAPPFFKKLNSLSTEPSREWWGEEGRVEIVQFTQSPSKSFGGFCLRHSEIPTFFRKPFRLPLLLSLWNYRPFTLYILCITIVVCLVGQMKMHTIITTGYDVGVELRTWGQVGGSRSWGEPITPVASAWCSLLPLCCEDWWVNWEWHSRSSDGSGDRWKLFDKECQQSLIPNLISVYSLLFRFIKCLYFEFDVFVFDLVKRYE